MSRTDILSEIKEAETKADASVAQAEADKKSAIAQARRDSVSKIQSEAEKLAAGEEEAEAIEAAAREKIKEVNDFLTNEFERAINASS